MLEKDKKESIKKIAIQALFITIALYPYYSEQSFNGVRAKEELNLLKSGVIHEVNEDGFVPLYSKPSEKSNVIATLEEKEALFIGEEKENWVYVVSTKGKGWIQKSYIRILVNKKEKESTFKKGAIGWINVKENQKVIVRLSGSDDAARLTTLSTAYPVELLHKEGEWIEIKLDGARGWIKEKEVSLQWNESWPIYQYFTVKWNEDGKKQAFKDSYSTLQEAKAVSNRDGVEAWNLKTNQRDVVYVTEGTIIAEGVPTKVYRDSKFKEYGTYIAEGTQLQLIETTNVSAVKVNVAGKTFYMKQKDARLLHKKEEQRISYYTAENNTLYHYVFSYQTKKYNRYTVQEAPTFMNEDTRYYSNDGITFTRKDGKKVGSIAKEDSLLFSDWRSPSGWSSKEFDAYLRATHPSSPLIGEGKAFIKAEKKYGVNALFLFSLACHESYYGTSRLAKSKNNLFGIRANDSDPFNNGLQFKSYETSIMAAAKLLSNKYMAKDGPFSNGPYLGNKSEGFNVYYASDMFWGQKIAGHAYRAQKWKEKHLISLKRNSSISVNVRE